MQQKTVWIVWSVTDFPGGRERIVRMAARWMTNALEQDLIDANAYCVKENAKRSAGESERRAVVAPIDFTQTEVIRREFV